MGKTSEIEVFLKVIINNRINLFNLKNYGGMKLADFVESFRRVAEHTGMNIRVYGCVSKIAVEQLCFNDVVYGLGLSPK